MNPFAWASAVLATAGVLCLGQGAWIHVKAIVAQGLLERAWSKTLTTHEPVSPWPWADTQPVGRLQVPAHGVDLVVLEGATGRTLAFAPGRLAGSAALGEPGTAVVAGHRDTHFGFLRALEIGQSIRLVGRDARVHRFRVIERRIVHERDAMAPDLWGPPRLELVTCYPFDTPIPSGPLRWVVTAGLEAELEAGLEAGLEPELLRRSSVFGPIVRAQLFAGQPVLADLGFGRRIRRFEF